MSSPSSSSSTTGTNSRFRLNEGDWICPDSQCGNVNFARRFTCNRCGKEKSSAPPKKKLGHEIGKAAAEKSRGLFSADDWQCGRCGNVNWARRQQCNMCNAPKFGEVEERTGLGGGYNERENVEYIEREESDGEFDDYGRKKKKFRKEDRDSDEETNDKKPVIKPVIKPHLSDDEGPKDISKYKLDSNEEDDDDDDDDEDGDLSKYDLSGWGDDDDKEEDKNKSNNNNNQKPTSAKRKSGSSQSSSSDEEDDSHSRKPKKLKKSGEPYSSSDSSSESSSEENKNHADRNSKRRSSRSRSSSGSRKRSDSSSSSGSSRSKSPVKENKRSS